MILIYSHSVCFRVTTIGNENIKIVCVNIKQNVTSTILSYSILTLIIVKVFTWCFTNNHQFRRKLVHQRRWYMTTLSTMMWCKHDSYM